MAASSLPREIISDILSRVPAKSVGRFRCVSKPWLSLLTQADFIKSHINRSKETLSSTEESLLVSDSKGFYSAPLSNGVARQQFDEMTTVATKLSFVARHFSPLESCVTCDGLILVRDQSLNWLLANPITKEFRVLPGTYLTLLPDSFDIRYGLGYDHVAEDYKVVAFSAGKLIVNVNVYSVRHDTWIRHADSSSPGGFCLDDSGVFLNGRIHWAFTILTRKESPSLVIGFDLVDEGFFDVLVPSSAGGRGFICTGLMVLDGCLGYIGHQDKSEKTAEVWVMKQYGVLESWTRIVIVVPQDSLLNPFQTVCMLGRPELVTSKIKKSKAASIYLAMYNLDVGTWKDLVLHGITDDVDFLVRGTFMETLVSPYCNSKIPLDSKPSDSTRMSNPFPSKQP